MAYRGTTWPGRGLRAESEDPPVFSESGKEEVPSRRDSRSERKQRLSHQRK